MGRSHALVWGVVVLLCVCACAAAPHRKLKARSLPQKLYGMPEAAGDCVNPQVCGPPLILTPLLAAGNITEAQQLSQVKIPQFPNIQSNAGFFTTNESAGNNMYWWYFPTQDGNASAPLLIWLQGGPGASSLFGLFSEVGPLGVTDNGTLFQRNVTWNEHYNLLFIDNPVGAGYSYTSNNQYCTNTIDCIAGNLYQLMVQFYTMFPNLAKNDLYITGESYGGHYIPGMAWYIMKQNQQPNPSVVLPLRGIAVGDGWVDPLLQNLEYPNVLKYFSLADTNEHAILTGYVTQIYELILAGNNVAAFDIWDKMINGDIWPYPTYVLNITGDSNYDSFVPPPNPDYGGWYNWVVTDQIRKMIHAGTATFASGHDCEMALLGDFMFSLKPYLAELLDNNYKVLLYNGQLDIIVGVALTERYVPTIPWKHQNQWPSVNKTVWWVNPGDALPAGYVRQYANFIQAVVRNAGHIVPANQPERALDLLTRFIEDLPFTN